jgi:hypothetical protein
MTSPASRLGQLSGSSGVARRTLGKLGSGPPRPPGMKFFRASSWYGGSMPSSANNYLSDLLVQAGRLGFEINDLESHSRPPNTQSVLSDLLSWLDEGHGSALSKVVNWRWLDLPKIELRIEGDREAKPRIEISAHITKMNNLSVRWHPAGWRESDVDWQGSAYGYSNSLNQRKFKQPTDFRRFRGDEEPSFNDRPSNELMYIRGVGNLHPEPREDYGPYSKYNRDVVDSILICAVRSAYECMIKTLGQSFQVEVLDAFSFEICEEPKSDSAFGYSTRRVAAWELVDVVTLNARAEEKREAQSRIELEQFHEKYSLSLADFAAALTKASAKKLTGPPPSRENIDRNTAKSLRLAGYSFDAGSVRHTRELLLKFKPELLPDCLQPSSNTVSTNVVPFPK